MSRAYKTAESLILSVGAPEFPEPEESFTAGAQGNQEGEGEIQVAFTGVSFAGRNRVCPFNAPTTQKNFSKVQSSVGFNRLIGRDAEKFP